MIDNTKLTIWIAFLACVTLALGSFIFLTSGWGALVLYIIILVIIVCLAG